MENKICGGKRTNGIRRESVSGKPLISVVTVVLNNKVLLEETIKSVLSQTYDNLEYIIVDGGSADGTLEVIKKYEDKIDYWQSEKDSGLFDAMNKGVKLASGEWIHLLNSDDCYVDSNTISNVSKVLKNPDSCFYYFTMYFDNLDGTRDTQKFKYSWFNHFKLYYSMYIPHPTMFLSKHQYDDLGLYDLALPIAADHDMVLSLCDKYQPVFTDIPVTIMRAGGFGSRNQKKTFNDFKKATIKHGLPKWLAELIYYFKILRYRIVKGPLVQPNK